MNINSSHQKQETQKTETHVKDIKLSCWQSEMEVDLDFSIYTVLLHSNVKNVTFPSLFLVLSSDFIPLVQVTAIRQAAP